MHRPLTLAAATIAGVACLLAPASIARAVPFDIHYADPDGHGFFDPVLGDARRAALEHATGRWADVLDGSVPVLVFARMSSAGGTATNALLASAGPVTVHRGFEGSLPNTWYPAALANQLVGADINGSNAAEIEIRFNVDVDRDDVLGPTRWYYGLDANPGGNIDLVTIALHEIGHGLGFLSAVDGATGTFLFDQGHPGIFERHLVWPGIGPFVDLRPAERLAAARSQELSWNGPNVVAFIGQGGAVFSPDRFLQGSSVGHWDPDVALGELMAPSFQGAQHDLGMLLPALADIGWQIRVDLPTPRASPVMPTPTATAMPTRFPVATPAAARDIVYTANFDDHTVTALEPGGSARTIPVGRGPSGLAVSPDGRRLYVANFHDGTLSVISTRRGRAVRTIAVGGSAHGVAASPDGTSVVVADTFLDDIVILDADSLAVRARTPGGRAPNAVAITPDNWAYVTAYGETDIIAIDLDTGRRRAILPAGQPYLLSITASTTGRILAVGLPARTTNWVDAWEETLAPLRRRLEPSDLTSIAVTADHALAVAVGHEGDASRILFFGDSHVGTLLGTANAGLAPEAVAFSSDEQLVYVANAGEDTVWTYDAPRRFRREVRAVGASPMAIAVAGVPQLCDGDCDGDGQVLVDELILAVGLGLGTSPRWHCSAADTDDDGRVTVDEVLTATLRALRGCSRD